MSQLNDFPLSTLQLYLTAPYPCSYLPQLSARSQVAIPASLITPRVYTALVHRGFRRSGTFVYRPRCDSCRQCVSVRVVVDAFHPTRSQRRSWKRHRNLHAEILPLQDKAEYFALYQRYQQARHPDNSNLEDNLASYRDFLLQSQVDSFLVEFRDGEALRMVSVIDVLDDGLSAVYTFYDPDIAQASFGTFNVLWQIELCRKLQRPYLYLGYWIHDSRKMAYKARFQPLQGLHNGEWRQLKLNEEENPC